MIFIDANSKLQTWKFIAEAGQYELYQGEARAGDIILRWGCNRSRYQNHYPANTIVLNKRIVLSKKEQGKLFLEHQVSTPKVYLNRTTWVGDGRPQLLVKPIYGQMGTGIKLVTNPDWSNFDVIHQLYIPKTREFRAMMLPDIIAFFMEKHPPENGDIRWNEHRGATWTSVPADENLRIKVRKLGNKGLKALDYDFGAIDIIMDEDGKLYILEINSRPEFGQKNAKRFVNGINQYLSRR